MYYSSVIPENFYEKLATRLAKIMEDKINKGGITPFEELFPLPFEFKISMNYYFEVHSDWGRKNKEILMISVFLDELKPGIERIVKNLLSVFSEKLQSNEEIYTAFYINDINNMEEQERKIIFKNDALVRSWIKELYWAIIKLHTLRMKSGDDKFPHPYIGNPPSPPGDLGTSSQIQVIHDPKEQESLWEKPYCKYCGSFLQEGQSTCHNCRNKVS